MPEYFLGIDGGGSKTHCALFYEDGILIDFLKWGTTSHEFLPGGYLELKSELKKMFDSIKQKNHLDWRRTSVIYGMAGVDSSKQQLLISKYIEDCGVKNFLLCNDSFLGIKAGSDKGWGICSMNGSGTGAGGMDASGNMHMVGRLFELSGDYAGGKILGSEVISHVYDYLFRDGEDTALCSLLYSKLKVDNRDDLMEEIISRIADRTLEAKEFAPLLFEAASKNDNVALAILTKCGKQNARDIIEVSKQLKFPTDEEIPVVLLGSLYTKAKHNQITQTLQKSLQTDAPDKMYKLIKLSVEPVVGAVCWAMENDHKEFNRNAIGKQIAQAI